MDWNAHKALYPTLDMSAPLYSLTPTEARSTARWHSREANREVRECSLNDPREVNAGRMARHAYHLAQYAVLFAALRK